MKTSLKTDLQFIWQGLKLFLTDKEIPIGFWVSWIAFLGMLIGLNYAFELENEVLDKLQPQPLLLAVYWCFYGLAFAMVIGLQKAFYLKTTLPAAFWWSAAWLLVIKILNGNLDLYSSYIENNLPWELQYFARRCLSNFSRAMIAFSGALIGLLLFSKEQTLNFYGLFSKGKSLKPYWVMLGLMAPVVWVASFQDDFLQYYPRYHSYSASEYLGIPYFLTLLVFELCYGSDFVAVELLFRGMMIWILGRYLGIHVVFPMATLYCMIHFGKPIGETISSVLGGTVLGVIAYHSRSILGGVFIHLGVAWLMELMATLHHLYK